MTTSQILFLDIETCPKHELLVNVPEDGVYAFKKRFQYVFDLPGANPFPDPKTDLEKEIRWQSIYEKEAPFMAEYSEVICVSVAMVHNNQLKVKSFTGIDWEGADPEVIILKELGALMAFENGSIRFDFACAHNGKMFDFPFLNRKFLMHGLPIPRLLNCMYKKPWEVSLLDTAEIWAFTNLKHRMSISMLCYALNVPTPKEIMTGAEVPAAFRRGEIEKIKLYCQDDAVAVAQLWRRIQLEPIFEKEQIVYA